MIKAAVIGDPISHSLSPKIHNYFLQKYNIRGSYEAIKSSKEDLKNTIENLVKDGYKGFNITIPHKESAINLCDHISQTARMIGAINTILILENGKIFGHNSDAQGFMDNIKYHAPNVTLKNKRSFVIGAGGAARALIYALVNEGVKDIIITNRNEIRAQKLITGFDKFAKSKNCQLKFLSKKDFENNLQDCDLLVNATSLGMENCDSLEINLGNLNKSALVNDIVYKPLITDLLQEVGQNDNIAITGIGMLIFQALVGFEMWFCKKVQYDECLAQKLICDQL